MINEQRAMPPMYDLINQSMNDQCTSLWSNESGPVIMMTSMNQRIPKRQRKVQPMNDVNDKSMSDVSTNRNADESKWTSECGKFINYECVSTDSTLTIIQL